LGIGAWGHQDDSPCLASLARQGLSFGNYLQAGQDRLCQFGLAAGLPACATSFFTPIRSGGPDRFGRFPDFQEVGYQCEWLQATDCSLSNWCQFMEIRQGRLRFEEHELEGLDRARWTSWGMPDEQLYRIAWQRYQRHLERKPPVLQVILTVSNHAPFTFPAAEGTADPANHHGGMRYADRSLSVFVRRLLPCRKANGR